MPSPESPAKRTTAPLIVLGEVPSWVSGGLLSASARCAILDYSPFYPAVSMHGAFVPEQLSRARCHFELLKLANSQTNGGAGHCCRTRRMPQTPTTTLFSGHHLWGNLIVTKPKGNSAKTRSFSDGWREPAERGDSTFMPQCGVAGQVGPSDSGSVPFQHLCQ